MFTWSVLWILIPWCFDTKASTATGECTRAFPVVYELSDFDALPQFQRNVLFVIAYRLSYFQIGVSNVTPRDQQPMDLKEWNLLKCKKRDAPVPAGVNVTISCTEAVRGRYLVIQFVGKSDYLSLCEVTVETREYMGPGGGGGGGNTEYTSLPELLFCSLLRPCLLSWINMHEKIITQIIKYRRKLLIHTQISMVQRACFYLSMVGLKKTGNLLETWILKGPSSSQSQLNSLWCAYATCSTLLQVMACYMTASSHHQTER